jgi:hypothetical protein
VIELVFVSYGWKHRVARARTVPRNRCEPRNRHVSRLRCSPMRSALDPFELRVR